MMDDIFKARLDSVFEKRVAATKAAEQAAQDRKTREEAFIENFLEARERVIRPVFEQTKQYLAGKGVLTDINTVDPKPDDERSAANRPSITIELHLTGERFYEPNGVPRFAATADRIGGKVELFESTISKGRGGHSGGVAILALEDLTEEKLLSYMVKWLEESV